MTQPHQIDREAVALSARTTAIFSVESGVGYNNLGDVIRAGLRALGYEGHLQSRTEQIVSRIEALSRRPAPEAVAWRESLRQMVAEIVEAAIERHVPTNSIRHTLVDADAILALIASHPVQGGESQ